jgi:hypothetical protein
MRRKKGLVMQWEYDVVQVDHVGNVDADVEAMIKSLDELARTVGRRGPSSASRMASSCS